MLVAVVGLAVGFYYPSGDGAKKDQVIMNMIYSVLSTNHFSPAEINDDYSEKVFDDFIENMDYSKRFLLAEDVKTLGLNRHQLDDELRQSSMKFFNEALLVYQSRFEQSKVYYSDILAEPFDFTLNEDYETDPEKRDFAGNEKELKERWRLYLKQRVLVRIEEGMHDQAEALAKEDTSFKVKTFEEREIAARKKELELHQDWYKNLEDMERLDWVGVYMNTFTNVYDPHTQYFPPERKEDFEISMTGQLEGIGAQLQQKGDYVTITKVITGSACWKQGDLEVDDKILAAAQEDETNDEAVDMVGMTVRKAVKYIRGKKGTEVRLWVQKVDGTKMWIPIVRDVVELEATFAKSAVLGEGKNKVGYIRLPKFYVNFYGDDNRDCAKDVKAELEKLKAENVSSVILDLRNNGGGSLQSVIDIVGLFIDKGPVVQVKAPGKSPRVLKDETPGIVYDGPLVVMVNQFSASASEIFAAAIQDYKRGLIIGSKSTFGKGTVQNVLDMDRAVSLDFNDVKPLGALKLTIQKYYRINGGTPQLKGVTPEIILPDNYNYIDYGEKEQDYALPYDEINAAQYTTWKTGVENYANAVSASATRIKGNAKFDLIDEYAKWLKEERDLSIISLNYEAYKKEQAVFRAESKKYKKLKKSDVETLVTSNKADVKMWEGSEEKTIERDKWFKSIARDLYLQEAISVANDLD